jgi:hypothetical protein
LKPAGVEKWCAAFIKADTYWDWVQHGGMWGSFPQVRGPGCCRVQFWLMLYLLFIERRKTREKWPRAFFPGQTCPVDFAMLKFSLLLGAIKCCFKGHSLNFMCA